MTMGAHISVSVAGESSAGSGSARNDAQRPRSSTVDQSCPAGAIAPLSVRGSSRSVSCQGCTT